MPFERWVVEAKKVQCGFKEGQTTLFTIYFIIHFKGLIGVKISFSLDEKSSFTLRAWEISEEKKEKGERSRFRQEHQGILSGIHRG